MKSGPQVLSKHVSHTKHISDAKLRQKQKGTYPHRTCQNRVSNAQFEVKCKIKEGASPCALVLLLSAENYSVEKCPPL